VDPSRATKAEVHHFDYVGPATAANPEWTGNEQCTYDYCNEGNYECGEAEGLDW
jgi:hypothetical protein